MVRVVVIAQPLAALWFWKAVGLPRGKPGSLQQAGTKSAAASKACQVGTRISWGHWQLLDCTHCRGSMHASNHRRLATSVYTVERQRELKPQKCCAPGRYAYRISLAGRPAKAAVLNDTISNPRQAPHSTVAATRKRPLLAARCSAIGVSVAAKTVRHSITGMRVAVEHPRGTGAEAASGNPERWCAIREIGRRDSTRRQQIRDVAESWRVELAQGVVGVHHPHHVVRPSRRRVSHHHRTVQLYGRCSTASLTNLAPGGDALPESKAVGRTAGLL